MENKKTKKVDAAKEVTAKSKSETPKKFVKKSEITIESKTSKTQVSETKKSDSIESSSKVHTTKKQDATSTTSSTTTSKVEGSENTKRPYTPGYGANKFNKPYYSRPYGSSGSMNRNFMRRKKFCKLCAKGIEHLDYKEVELISKYLTPSLKIASRKLTGACSSHQRKISNAVKRARVMALIPYVKD